jgi:hypothetical protein
LRDRQFAEKVIFRRLLKNAQMQVEPCEIPFAGAPEILRRERIYAFPTWLYGATTCPVR